jgi:hypothetical protein
MALPVPSLDDRTFEDLVAEGRTMIPRYFPPWTDHNVSDPGMTLLELFAFLLEAAIYQLDRVPERSQERFAELVGTSRGKDASGRSEPIEVTLRRAMEGLGSITRGVTRADLERLARSVTPEPGTPAIARANVVVRQAAAPNVFPEEQTIELGVVPDVRGAPDPTPTAALRKRVFDHLNSRRLITTRLRVVPPVYQAVDIEVIVVRDPASPLDTAIVERDVTDAVRRFLSPLQGGTEGVGWEFGRSVYRSELYQVIEGTSGVDHVHRLLLNGDEQVDEVPMESPTGLVRFPNPPSVKVAAS